MPGFFMMEAEGGILGWIFCPGVIFVWPESGIKEKATRSRADTRELRLVFIMSLPRIRDDIPSLRVFPPM